MALVSKINKEIAGAASAAKQVAQKAAKATSRDKDKRDEFDASARSNYAARTQSVSTPKSGYFSLQSTKQQGERLANTVGAFEAATAKSAKALQTANDEATRLGKALQQKSTQMKELEGYANQPNSGIAKSLYNKAVGEYGELQSAYETAADNAQKAWEEYEPMYNKYAQAADEYNRYQKQSQETYRDWRSRIRSTDKIQAEAQQTDQRLKELTKKRDELTGEAQRLNGIAYGTTGSRAQRRQWQTQAETATQEADRLQSQIDELTQKQGLLKEEEDWSKYFGYQDLMANQDFREKSAYKSTANGKTRSIMDRLTDNFEESGYDDPLYEYINGNQQAGAFLRNRAGEDNGEAGTLGNLFGRATEGNQESQQMTEDEIAIYNYLYATKGKEAASEYYDYLENDLNYRQRQSEEEYWQNYAQESPGMASVFSILTSPAKGLSYVAQAADYIGTGEIDQNEAYNRFSYAPGAIRQKVTEDVEKKWGKVGSFAYQTGMSMADFLFTNLVSGGFSGFASGSAAQKLTEGIALGIMGSGAAADSVIQAKDRGVDDGMAFALGTIAGGAEIFTEKFSIDALLEGKMEKSAIQYILKNAFTEGTEEVGSDIINLMADVILAKDKSEWMRAVEAYKEKGMTDSEAFGHAVGDQAMQMLLDAAGGTLSGGFMSGGKVLIGSARQQSTYAQTGETLRMLGDDVTQGIIDNGLQAGKETSAYKLAEKLQKKMQKNQSISNADLGKLFAMTGLETQTAASTETKQEAEQEAEQEGIMLPTAEEAENAQRTAEIAQPGAEIAQPITENVQPITENVQLITEPGMLPTAAEAERQQRIREAGTELERSAIENNVRDELYQRTQRISEAIGRDVRFYTAEDAAENGYYDNDTGIIYVNANSQNPVAQIISHELTHSIEGADAYKKLQGIILNRIEQSGRNIDAMRRRKENLYAAHGKTLTTEAIDQEIIAEYVERNLLTDEQSIRELVSADRTIGQRILNWLDGLLAKIGVESAQERAFVRNARDLYAQALQQDQTAAQEPAQTEDVMSRTMAMMQSSFGGRNANRADLDALQQAQEMQLRNVDPETIRRETGWFTGADGKWRFEIDDSGMEYRRNGDAKFAQDPEYNEYLDLWNKAYRDGDASDEEIERMRELDKKYGRVGQVYALSMANGFATLDDIIVHDDLFENYPQLRETKVEFADLGRNVAGQYNRDTDTITLSYGLRNAQEDTLVHEIQHAIQRAEGFASGASTEYWRDRSGRGAENEYERQFANLTDEQQSEWNRYQDLERTLRNLFLQDGNGEEYRRYEAEQDAMYDRLHQEQWFRDMLDAEADRLDERSEATERYMNTAGEIEARDAASRRQMTAKERRDTEPNTGDENTVFAETEDGSDISAKQQFNLSEPVEQTGTLLALHNMDEEKLRRTLNLGAWPSPSIAIVQAQQGHANFGEYSVVFPRSTIDPQEDRRNKVYGSDAWTPTHNDATVEYEVNYDAQRAFENKIADLSGRVANGTFRKSSVLQAAGISNDQSSMGIEDLARKLSNYESVRAAYLADRGEDIEPVYRKKEFDSYGNDALQRLIDRKGEAELTRLADKIAAGERLSSEETESVRDVIIEDWKTKNIQSLNRRPELMEKRIAHKREQISDLKAEDFVMHAEEYLQNSGETTDEIDRLATYNRLEEAAPRREVENWVRENLQGVLGEPGIFNGRERFTASGKRKSFQQTHWEYTAENIVRAMNQAKNRGQNAVTLSGEGFAAIASPEYRDVEQIHADEGRLRDADDFNQIMMTLEDDLKKAVRDIAETSGKDAEYMFEEQEAILEIIAQAARGSRTAANIRRTFQSEGYRITDRQAQEVKRLLDYAASAPTKYFEAKPQRVVGFNEALAIIAPTDAPIELVAAIRNAGMNVIDYEAGNDQSRLDAIRSVEGAQFSYGREDRQEILQNMRSILNRGGSAAELRRYIDSVDNNRIDLPTYEQTRNEPERIVRDAHRQGLDVREYINRNWEQFELDGAMNDDARAAVDLERRQSGRRYSLDENPADETTEELRSKTTDSFLDDLTEGTQIEPERADLEREDLERMRQRDLDEFWQEAIRAADVLEPRTNPEDKVSTAAQKKQRTRREKASEAWSYFKRKMVDSGEAVTRIGKAANDRNLYHYYNMARSSSNAATSMILKERTDISGRATGKGLNDVMDAIRKKGDDYYKKFQLYMFHQHNIDRMSRFSQERVNSAQAALEYYRLANPEVTKYADFQLERMANDETSPLYFEAGEYIALRDALRTAENTKDKPVFGFDVSAEDSRGIVQTLEQENPDFRAEAEEVYGYIENLLRYRVDSGLISEQDYNTLKTMYPHYVPTYRVFEKGTDTSETNRVRVGSTIRRATGSSEKIMPLHKALAQQTMSVVREGSKNRFGMRLMDFGRNVKEHVRDIHEFRDQFNENTFDLPEDDAFKKRNTFVVREDGKLWEIEVSPALYEAVQALSPETPENNVLFNVLRKGNNLYKSLITGYNPTFTVRNFFRDMADAGLYSKNSAEFAKQYPQAVREIAKDGKYWRQYHALGGTYSTIFDYETGETDRGSKLKQKTLGRIEALNMAVEQAPRLAEFMATVKKAEAAHGAATMDDLMEAMYNAADITVNFGRSGTIGKQLNATVAPFLNPGIQGFDKMIRNVTETKGAKEWAKLAVKVAALGIAPTIINSLIYHDDEDWEALKDRDKDVNYLFKIGDHTWLKIPKGRTLSVIGMAADRTGDKLKGEDVDWSEFISTVVSQTAPSNPLTTNIAAPMVQTKLFDPDNPGTTWYGGDIENQRMQSYAPAERYDSSTDALSKFLGKTFNLSPAKINYLLDQYTGVVGDVLLPMTSAAPQRDMFSDAFTIDSNRSNRYSNDFYARLDELQYAKNATNADAVDSIVYKYWNRQSQAVSDINKAIRKIEEDQTISKKEKQELLDVQYAMRNEIIRSAMDSYEDYVNAVNERYNDSTAEDEEDRADEAYRAANRDVLGAEYALKTYNSSVYKTAQEMAEKGVDYETFYDFYFRNKAAADSNEEREILMDLDVSDKQKKALYTKYISDGRQDDIDAFEKAGMDFNTYLETQNEYTTIQNAGGSANEKRTEFAAWVYDQKLTDEQKMTIMDSFAFYSHIPADQGRYEDLLNLGIDKDAAYKISSKLGDLQPEAGKTSVSGEQKWRVIIDSGLSPQDQLTALEAVTSESQRRKFNAAYQFGIDPEIYLLAKEAMPKFDSDGNGKYKYEEIEDMLRSFGGSGLQLPGAQNVTNEEKAVLWQLITGSSSARNNPYSSRIGWAVIDAVNNPQTIEANDLSGLLKLPK